MEGLEIFGKNEWRPALHFGQTDEIQEVGDLEATSCQEQQPQEVLLASSFLAGKLHAMGPRSVHSEVETGQSQAATGSRGVWPHTLGDSS